MKTKSEVWFEKLGDIWERKAADEIGGLVDVSGGFKYFEDPFDEVPITDVDALVGEWQAVQEQEIEVLKIEPLVCTDEEGTARYHFVAMINGERHESKGSYYVRLNTSGQATEFRQWWNNKK